MLDSETKRRIDTARDILVGKVPDPKSQVEQITIALIYKFMDDMDAESEEFGGKRKFFADEFARYGWAKLLRSGLGGFETLNLYAEAIAKMPENPGIPLLFRDIFKNAYLPYRDPETLRAFLKIIDEFNYDHSERLGDAFEYLLSVLGSQGDAGQFRTPRHIIDFMVAVLDPKKAEIVLDPACGTAGFLISSYKHIMAANTDAKGNITLTPDERGRLMQNFKGYDISPDMVRLSLVNLYLHGFVDPHIAEYDTLTSLDKWNEYSDVILANPPFMSPKGGGSIKPHKRFSVQSSRSEVLFVDYIAEHLMPTGRAGIIVPEGIIFQSQNAYKQLRKMLVEDFLVAVVSLPAGMFNPYSGVKTSILILDKTLAKKASTIAFFKLEKDGYGLGAQRRPLCSDNGDKPELCPEHSDIPPAHKEISEYLRRLRTGESMADFQPTMGLVVEKEKVATNGDYNLSGERYKQKGVVKTNFPLVSLGDLMPSGIPSVDPSKFPDETFELWSIPAFDSGSPEVCDGKEIGSQKKCVKPGDVLLSKIVPHIRRAWVVTSNNQQYRQIASGEWIIFRSADIVPKFLQRVLVANFFHSQFMRTVTGVGGSLLRANPEAIRLIQIPLPPLEVQNEIVAEIEGYQKVIDGAQQVVENYHPHIRVDPDWPKVRLGDVCESITDGDHQPPPKSSAGVPFVTISNINDNHELDFSKTFFVSEDYYSKLSTSRKPQEGDILYTVTGSYGIPVIITSDIQFCFQRHIALIRPSSQLLNSFLYCLILSPSLIQQANEVATGVAQKTVSLNALRNFQIPLPPLAVQQAIAAEIEAEQALVESTKKLIDRFEKKIQDTLSRVWGDRVI